METEILTATRCLNELKLLDKRINKKIQNSCFITTAINGDNTNKDCDPQSDIQSVQDLITRRENIKTALMLSNSVTIVKIGKEEMTVASAIEKKSSITYLADLLVRMREQRKRATRECELRNEDAQTRLDRLLEVSFGKDLKARPTEITEISDTFWRTNKMDFYDPIEISKKIEEMDEYIDNFKNEVDLILSESNSIVKVTI